MKLLEHCAGYGHYLKAPLGAGLYWECAGCGFHPAPVHTGVKAAKAWNDAVEEERRKILPPEACP